MLYTNYTMTCICYFVCVLTSSLGTVKMVKFLTLSLNFDRRFDLLVDILEKDGSKRKPSKSKNS